MNDGFVCRLCEIDPPDQGSTVCRECRQANSTRSRHQERRVTSILNIPITAEAPNGIGR
jgi:Mg-chelatase subunit ChlI